MNTSKLPKIPTIIFVVSKADPDSPSMIREEFTSWRELNHWAIDQRDINKAVREEYSDFSKQEQRQMTLVEYLSEHLERFLGEEGYRLDRVPLKENLGSEKIERLIKEGVGKNSLEQQLDLVVLLTNYNEMLDLLKRIRLSLNASGTVSITLIRDLIAITDRADNL